MFTNPIRSREKTITVVGAPFALGQPRPGVDQGPEYLRRAGLIKELKEQGWNVEDSGDVSMQSTAYVRAEAGDKTIQYGNGETNSSAPTGKSWKEHRAEAVSDACRALSIAVNKPAREGKFTLTVGGDHSIAIGSISGILRAQPGTRVIWVDAHADINTPETTETGNLHGMPVAYLMGIVNSHCFEWLKTESEALGGAPVKLLPQHIAYIGLREVDKGELEILRRFNISTFTMIDVDRLGIQEVIRRAVEAVDPEGDSPLHLSFDVDGLDASVAASTGTPVVGGLSYREGRQICEYLGATQRLISMDMVEVNPTLRPEHARTTARVGIHMIAGAVKPKTDRRSWAFKRPMWRPRPSRVYLGRPRMDRHSPKHRRSNMSKTMSIVKTSLRAEGAGPTVICLHASAGSSKQWQPLSERLRPGYRVLAPDLYGYGMSFACDTGRPCSLNGEAALIEPLLAGVPQGMYLVGHSYGAAVALKLALAHPERIRGLVLCEPTLFGLLFAEKPAHRAAMEIGVARLTIRRYLGAGKPFLAAQRFVDYWSGEGTWRSLPPSQQEAIARRMPLVLANLDALLADVTPLSEYARIDAPVLCLTGARTRASAQCVAQILTRALPRAEWRQLPGAGHMGLVSHAEEVNHLIQRFLAAQRRGAPSEQCELGATAELAWAV